MGAETAKETPAEGVPDSVTRSDDGDSSSDELEAPDSGEEAGALGEDGEAGAAPSAPAWSLEDDDTREAWNVLRRGMWPKESIVDFFNRDLAGALDTAKKLADYQAENARAYQQAKSQEAKTGSEAEGTEAPRPAVDLHELARPLAGELGLDEDGAKRLVEFADRVAESRTKALTEQAEKFATELGGVTEVFRGLIGEMTRRALLGEIPALADDQVFGKVQKVAYQIAADPESDIEGTGLARTENIYREAARRAIKDLPSPKEVQRQQQAEARRRNGNPARPTARAQKPALTDAEHIEQVIAATEAMGRDEIVRQFGVRPLRK